MGCVSSNLLNQEDDFSSQLGLGHHIVSLTSTTYGLLTLDPLSEPNSLRTSEPPPFPSQPQEVINSWELMSGLDPDTSFRFSPNKENSNPNPNPNLIPSSPSLSLSHRFQKLCPPNGQNRVVIYTTTLRGVRHTFEACNAVRAAFQAFGVLVCERDVSMDSGFREELRALLKGKEREATLPPRVFVKGFYVGGAEEMLKVAEEGLLGKLLEGLPRKKLGSVCEGCGDMRFLPCFTCNGSCKVIKEDRGRRTVVVKCCRCNENGLVLCPLCS